MSLHIVKIFIIIFISIPLTPGQGLTNTFTLVWYEYMMALRCCCIFSMMLYGFGLMTLKIQHILGLCSKMR